MQKFAVMVGSSALFALVVLAVLEPAAGFAGPHALLPLRARSVLDRVLGLCLHDLLALIALHFTQPARGACVPGLPKIMGYELIEPL